MAERDEGLGLRDVWFLNLIAAARDFAKHRSRGFILVNISDSGVVWVDDSTRGVYVEKDGVCVRGDERVPGALEARALGEETGGRPTELIVDAGALPRLVRCRDCVRGAPVKEGTIRCLRRREYRDAEWFCADGKEREC